MSFINHNAKIIHCKVVYCGPSLSGKTTNLQWIYNKISEDNKSKLVELPTDTERTIFFDFLPMDVGPIGDFETRFHYYTVPGQVAYDTNRKLILRGVDGVIFVADSQEERREENLQSLANLKDTLAEEGIDYNSLSMVFQYNKRDLPNALPLKKLRADLNDRGAPEVEASAVEGTGVFETMDKINGAIVANLRSGF